MVLLTRGRLAKQTRLAADLLNHYESIGLLKPSSRSNGGEALYDHDDVVRLYRIQTLRRLGMSLTDVAALLPPEAASLPEIIDRHVNGLDDQILQAIRVRTQLDGLRDRLMQGDHPHLGDWLATLELMSMYERTIAAESSEEQPNDEKLSATARG